MAKFRRRARGRQVQRNMINEGISYSIIKVVIEDQGAVEMSKSEALKIAEGKNLDLVLITESSKPPLCKIIDYGKYLYEQKKKDNQKHKTQQKTEVKGMRLSMNIGEHDLEIKARQAKEFLKEKNAVKVTMQFRGREMSHMHLGVDKMNHFAEVLAEVGQVDQEPKAHGRQVHMLIVPGKKKK